MMTRNDVTLSKFTLSLPKGRVINGGRDGSTSVTLSLRRIELAEMPKGSP